MEFTTTGQLNEADDCGRTDGIHIDMERLKKGEVNLGTSIMAVTFKDGVILGTSDLPIHVFPNAYAPTAATVDIGADSRTTTGAYIANRVTDKLTQVHDTIWCCRSGSAADTQAVADIVQYQLGLYAMRNGKPPMTQTAAAIFQEVCYANKDRLTAGLIIAGWDERHGGQVYSIPLGGSLHKQSYAIGGSGSTYIYGYCDEHWKEGMEEKEAVDFVKGSLKEAIKWDGSSGGVIRMVVLTAKGAVRHLYLPDEDYKVQH
ncbi:proteasome component PRE3 [Colletotrichum lupini]|uniref:proteasome endopeptidase complex n=1 Tax=Colletotrichum lupini TaxID=145971 RepID=A0A9Q8WJU1_9PEZI|nr:proteasome component PRE3 [Colletotrichum lupini]UQC86019.1 proteasome component PRE3 [Colletotrichum lupini]